MNRSWLQVAVLTGLAALTAPFARAEKGGVEFAPVRMVDGHPYLFMGSATRHQAGEPLYTMALYVEASEARRAFPALAMRAGGKERGRLLAGDHGATFLIWGQFGKLAILRVERSLSTSRVREELRNGLASGVAEAGGGELERAAEQLVDLFDRDLESGQELILQTHGDQPVVVDLAGQHHMGPPSAKLPRALWASWFGGHPLAPEMRRPLMEHLDELGR